MAAVDYFVKLDGIKGESTDARHKDEVEVESWSWGETFAGGGRAGGGAGAGKVTMQDFHFVARFSRASPALMKACATGQHIKTATLSARRAGRGQPDYLTIRLHDVVVTAYAAGAAEAADGAPVDQVSLAYSKLEVDYKQQKPDGSLATAATFGFDLKTNKAL